MKNRILKQLLVENGFEYIRSHGDHHIYKHPKLSKPITLCGDDGHESIKWIENKALIAIKKTKKKK